MVTTLLAVGMDILDSGYNLSEEMAEFRVTS